MAAGSIPASTIKTWRERIGVDETFPLHAPTDVERAMVAQIQELEVAVAQQAGATPVAGFAAWLAQHPDLSGFSIGARGQEVWVAAQQAAAHAEKFCDANCVWTNHHPDCQVGAAHAQQVAAAPSDLTTVDCPACDGMSPCDECSGQGKIIVSRADLAALHVALVDSEGGHHD
jgi:hypothetical protein